ncbi:MAG TPA: membrane protein insertase YidC [Bradyrhizobium sp.]|uniref:membrane protein insertase YidC n=1 Tax=Bradyrhizobium sp. TaxID=376 RepID=UPI002C58DD03|nr:membrane protein insertase YidC [Bradyrhizobium sp.]HTB03762.1 membrane protein insertase YidC [Bradyrhizobium sp.]
MHDQNNVFYALALSVVVLITWQYFFATSFLGKPASQPGPVAAGIARPQTPAIATRTAATTDTQRAEPIARLQALARSQRVAIDTPRLKGSIALTGGRIDDLALVRYRETTDPTSPAIELLSPAGSPYPFYAEFGWVDGSSVDLKVPTSETVWRQEGADSLGVGRPVTLVWQNGQGLEFRRTISVDDKYLFSIGDEVLNSGDAAVLLAPYALISRHNPPPTSGYYLLHEGAIGVLGDQGLQEVSYKNLDDKKRIAFNLANAWLGFTDKYWAAALLPDPAAHLQAEFSAHSLGALKTYQADYVEDIRTVAPGGRAVATIRLFAGAKEVAVIDGYDGALHLNRFDLAIDWGWFRFITKPMFTLIDGIYRLVGNFGVAILLVTLMLKVAFFPLASKSYASAAKMKALQPQLKMIRESFADDKVRQQQATMQLYRKEKINPIAGCLPTLIQIPVFFALYKVLFITIEMRQAPFFGWIRDLSAPDPTNVFNLFGLIPYDTTSLPLLGGFLIVGAWPLIMGVTQWLQLKLTPASADPAQAAILGWLPLIFTFMLAKFSAGLVIYWTWNNSLTILQQAVVMRRNGVRIGMWDSFRARFGKRKSGD